MDWGAIAHTSYLTASGNGRYPPVNEVEDKGKAQIGLAYSATIAEIDGDTATEIALKGN